MSKIADIIIPHHNCHHYLKTCLDLLPFDREELKKHNYISTMSLIRAEDFSGFDEKIKRLQDWDLWLTMIEQGKTGVYCGKRIFSTKKGTEHKITAGYEDYKKAYDIIKRKHNL